MNAIKQKPAWPGVAAPRSKKSVLLLVGGGALCFAAGYALAPATGQRPSSASETSAAALGAADDSTGRLQNAPQSKGARRIERPFLIRPTEACPTADPEAEQRYRAQQSRELMELLSWRIKAANPMGLQLNAEAVATQLTPYVTGWADALVRTAPDLADDLAAEIQGVMCDRNASRSQLLVMSRVVKQLPELGNERTFDCIVERNEEDDVLWEALDAWRISGLPKTAGMERLEQATSDERTRHRLVKRTDEEIEALTPPEPEPAFRPEPPPGQERRQLMPMPAMHEAALALALTNARSRGDAQQTQVLTTALDALRAGDGSKGARASAGPPAQAQPDSPAEP
jgi:hypothetical protein